MSCVQRRDLMLLYAAGQLDPLEQEQVEAHLQLGCRECEGYLSEAHATVTGLALACPPAEPAPRVWPRLLSRVRASASASGPPVGGGGGGSADTTGPVGFVGRSFSGLVAAVAGLLVGFSAAWMVGSQQRDEIGQLQAEVAELADEPDNPAVDHADADETPDTQLESLLNGTALADLMDTLRSSTVRFINFQGVDDFENAHGRLVWDSDNNQCYFFASELDPNGSDTAYHLWLRIVDERLVSVGTFRMDDGGTARFSIDLPTELDQIEEASISYGPLDDEDEDETLDADEEPPRMVLRGAWAQN